MFGHLLLSVAVFFAPGIALALPVSESSPAFLRGPDCRDWLVAADEGNQFRIPTLEAVRLIRAPRNYRHIASPPKEAGVRTQRGRDPIRPYVVAYRGNMYREFTLDRSEVWPSPSIVPLEGIDGGDSKRMIFLLHGMGGSYSHMGSWLGFMKELVKRMPGSAVSAMDLPRHGFLKSSDWEPSYDSLVESVISEIERVKALSCTPLTLMARSAASGVALAIAKRRPDLIAKLVLIGPTASRPDLLHECEQQIDRMVRQEELILNEAGYAYAKQLMRQAEFHNWRWSEWKVPTEIYLSKNDPEGSENIRRYWQDVGEASGGRIRVAVFESRRHDPFTAQEQGVQGQVWSRFIEFH